MPLVDIDVARRLHQRARAWQWDVPVEAFAAALEHSAARIGTADPAALATSLEALHLDDLALACACAAGHERAWEQFMRVYRPLLQRAATAIAGAAGPDLADALHADLFGLTTRDGVRQSLFRYFHGRSSLVTWLRAVLAQRCVDAARVARRSVPLPDDEGRETSRAHGWPGEPGTAARTVGTAGTVRTVDPVDPDARHLAARVTTALGAAIGRLAPRDRLRLSWYYAGEMTLAQIGRALTEHEATVSRNLARVRRTLRDDVEQQLATTGMTAAAIDEAFDTVLRDAGDADLDTLLGTEPARKNPPVARSRGEDHA